MNEISIKELRARKNKTQLEVATAIGVSPQTYNNWEVNGIALAKLENIRKVAQYFEVPMDTLKIK